MKVSFNDVQLDKVESGHELQNALKEITGQRTVSISISFGIGASILLDEFTYLYQPTFRPEQVPNIFIKGTSIGGCDGKSHGGTLYSALLYR